MFISNGILFNHESPRRGTNFVTNKVCKEAVKIKLGLSNELKLGNLDATRDWGHAKDYVEAMWMILQQEKPDDYVCSTGISHSVQDLCDYTFSKLGLDYKKYVIIDTNFKVIVYKYFHLGYIISRDNELSEREARSDKEILRKKGNYDDSDK